MINKELIKEISDYIDNNLEEEVIVEKCIIYYDKCYDQTLGDKDVFIREPEETFSQQLLAIIDAKNLTDADVYNKANIDRRLFSKIRCDKDYSPSKQTVLAFCIALNLNIDETEDLLERAGYALSLSNRADLIVRYFIEEKKDYALFDVDEALLSFDQKPISKY